MLRGREPLHRPLGETEHMLEQWGWWRMDGMGIPSYASPMLALMRDALPSSTKSYTITDELACVVDGALASYASVISRWAIWFGCITAPSGRPFAWAVTTR